MSSIQKIFKTDQSGSQKNSNNPEIIDEDSLPVPDESEVSIEVQTKDVALTDSTDLMPNISYLTISPSGGKLISMEENISIDELPNKTRIKINIQKVGTSFETENDKKVCSLDDLLDSLPRVQKNVYTTILDGDKKKNLTGCGTFNRRRKKGAGV